MLRRSMLFWVGLLGVCATAHAGEAFVSGQSVSAEQAVPQVCLELASPAVRALDIPLERFVDITPPLPRVVASARNGKLCLEGFAHGASYRISLRKGLPTQAGPLSEDAKADVFIPDRMPSVAFMGRGHVLPRIGSGGLPLRVVNVPKLRIRIARIHDRNLLSSLSRVRDDEALGAYAFSEISDNAGEQVWEGTLASQGPRNTEVVVALPVAKVVESLKPGVYVAMAAQEGEDEAAWRDQATQWFVVSDLGLTSFLSDGGLVVAVRSLETAKAIADAEVVLLSRNNKELVHARTNREGLARIEAGMVRGQGGNAPQAVYVYGAAGDFAFLDFGDTPVDFSDRGDNGRASPGALDVFAYTERGAYRPGETVHLAVLLRDAGGRAVLNVPLTATWLRPDDSEADREVLDMAQAGAATTRLLLPDSAMTGSWNVVIHAGDRKTPLARIPFMVEDFSPPRIAFDLVPEKPFLTRQEGGRIRIASRFLYGAPGAGLSGEVRTSVRVAETPFPDFAGYQFGLVQEEVLPLDAGAVSFVADAEGQALVDLSLPSLPETSHALEADLKTSVMDVGGRSVQRSLTLPVFSERVSLGVRATFDGAIPEGHEATFSAVALDGLGKPVVLENLRWELLREEWHYTWYRVNGTWNVRSVVLDLPVSSGIWASGEKPESLSPGRLSAGQYRLEVFDPESGAASSLRFSSGWWFGGEAREDRPDNVTVVPPALPVVAGADVELFITPPFESEVMVMVAGRKPGVVTSVHLTEKGGKVRLHLPEDEMAGVHVLATAISRPEAGKAFLPRRAVGMAWIPYDTHDRQLGVALDLPELVRPDNTLVADVAVSGAQPDEPVFLILSAVDEGVLQLSGYSSPDPYGYYFGPRRMAGRYFDVYGQLINPQGAVAGAVESGGDFMRAMNRQMGAMPAKNTRIVSLFSGVVPVDGQGHAQVPLVLPEWNGSLRVMAVAFSASKAGAADRQVVVRAPLVVELVLPRFLAVGDTSEAVVSLHNVEGPAGPFAIDLATSGSLAPSPKDRIHAEVLDIGARREVWVPLSAQTLGEGRVDVSVKAPSGQVFVRHGMVDVRPLAAHETRMETHVLQPHAKMVAKADLLKDMLPGTGQARLMAGFVPELGIPGMVAYLQAYPYGCAEQTASRLRAWLALESLGLPVPPTRDSMVMDLVRRLSGMQGWGGQFTPWGGEDASDAFVSAEGMDVLLEARKRGFSVPSPVLDNGMKALRGIAAQNDPSVTDMPSVVHAAHVLARAGDADIFRLRQLRDQVFDRLPTPMARAELAAAFALMGDKATAFDLFRKVDMKRQESGKTPYGSDWYLQDYGSALRDAAAVATLAIRSGLPDSLLRPMLEHVVRERAAQPSVSTQEAAWLVQLASELAGHQGIVHLAVDGNEVTSDRPVDRAIPEQGLVLENRGESPLYLAVSVSGIPEKPSAAVARGYTLQRQVFTLDGKEVRDFSRIRQNTQMVVLLSGQFDAAGMPDTLVADMLPAGFELVPSQLSQGIVPEGMRWLEKVTASRHAELRDDRFLAALYASRDPFRMAYLLRAITPGTYTWPGPHVEDMYGPQRFATGTPLKVQVVAE